jgi:hypothetical protein
MVGQDEDGDVIRWIVSPPAFPVGGSVKSVCYPLRSNLLKKSAVVSMAEKYALEVEIFILSRGFKTQISRSGAQESRFQRLVCGQSGGTEFFNRIDPLRASSE